MPRFSYKIEGKGQKNPERVLKAPPEKILRKNFKSYQPLLSLKTPFSSQSLFLEPPFKSLNPLKELKKELKNIPNLKIPNVLKNISKSLSKSYEWLYVFTKPVKDRIVGKFKLVKGSFTKKF